MFGGVASLNYWLSALHPPGSRLPSPLANHRTFITYEIKMRQKYQVRSYASLCETRPLAILSRIVSIE